MNTSKTWEKTFILLKPDAVQRALIGTLIARFERAGLVIMALKMCDISRELAEKHYESHRNKPYFEPLIALLTSGPAVAMSVAGAHAIDVVRKIVGATEPQKAVPGSIRGDYCHMSYERSRERLGVIPNLIHASDSPENAALESNLWFSEDDYMRHYERGDAKFM